MRSRSLGSRQYQGIRFILFIQVKTLPLPVGEGPGVRGAPTPVIVGASVAASAPDSTGSFDPPAAVWQNSSVTTTLQLIE